MSHSPDVRLSLTYVFKKGNYQLDEGVTVKHQALYYCELTQALNSRLKLIHPSNPTYDSWRESPF